MLVSAKSCQKNGGRYWTFACLALAWAIFSPMVIAKKDDRAQQLGYVAKTAELIDAPNSVSTLTGHVRITQGTLLITGDLAKLYLDGDQHISRVVVTGKPAHIQQLDESNTLMQGEAATLDYDNIKGIAVLTTKAMAKQQGRGEFHGDKLTYNTETGAIVGESVGDNLVTGVLLPKQKSGTSDQIAPAPVSSEKHGQSR